MQKCPRKGAENLPGTFQELLKVSDEIIQSKFEKVDFIHLIEALGEKTEYLSDKISKNPNKSIFKIAKKVANDNKQKQYNSLQT